MTASEPHTCKVDLDIHSEEYRARGIEREREARGTCPVAWTPHNGGHWVVSGHAQVGTGLRDPGVYSTVKTVDENGNWSGGVTIPTAKGYHVALPNESDPPGWERYRRAVAPYFTPRAVDARRETIAMYASEVIDHMIELGEADFVMQVGSPVTALITLDMVGLPLTDWRFYAERVHQSFMGIPGDGTNEAGLPGVTQRLRETIERRRVAPAEGLMDRLIADDLDGHPLSDAEIEGLIYDLIVGGFDTTAGLLAGAVRWLEGKTEVKERLIADETYLRTATDEFLRWISPAVGLRKTATTDFQLDGHQIRQGDPVWFMYRGANRDPARFEDPDIVDLERSPNPHYAFGAGIHRCLGSHLARAIFQTVLPEFLRRLPDYTVVQDQIQPYPFACVNAGYATMPIRYTPGAKVRDTPILATL